VVTGEGSAPRLPLLPQVQSAETADVYFLRARDSAATPIDYIGGIREIEGRPVSNRGRIPGMQRHERLQRIL
jgi:hypothetical protein